MIDGLNFKEFVAFLSAFSAHASLQQKVECKGISHFMPLIVSLKCANPIFFCVTLISSG